MKRILLLALFCGSAHAEFMTGNKLLANMQGSTSDQIYAIGYVIGVADAVRGVSYCPPETVSAGQLSDMVKNFMINTPSIRHFAGDVIVNHVLKSTWPCAERKKGTGI